MLSSIPMFLDLPPIDRYLGKDSMGRDVFSPARFSSQAYIVSDIEKLRMAAGVEMRWPNRLIGGFVCLCVLSFAGVWLHYVFEPELFAPWRPRLMRYGDAFTLLYAATVFLLHHRGLRRLAAWQSAAVTLTGADVIRIAISPVTGTPQPYEVLKREARAGFIAWAVCACVFSRLAFHGWRFVEVATVGGLFFAAGAWYVLPRWAWLLYLSHQAAAVYDGRPPPRDQPRRVWLTCICIAPLLLIAALGLAVKLSTRS